MYTNNKLFNSRDRIISDLSVYKNADIVIFGTGASGMITYDRLKMIDGGGGKKVVSFIDNDLKNDSKIIIDSIKCEIPEKFIANADKGYIYIIATGYHLHNLLSEQVKKLLSKYNKKGIVLNFDEYILSTEFNRSENIFNNYLEDEKSINVYKQILYARLNKDETLTKEVMEPVPYFLLPEFSQHPLHNEVFVDLGAWCGDTVERYLIFHGGENVKKIYAFEPYIKSFNALKIRTERLIKEWGFEENQIIPVNMGIGDKEIKISYKQGSLTESGGYLCEGASGMGNSFCNTTSLDSYFKEKIDFIKADIEGYEVKMIMGAQRIIKSYKPKLAICIYHSPADLFLIPEMIKKLVPEYKMKIRHHSRTFYETVLYCYL